MVGRALPGSRFSSQVNDAPALRQGLAEDPGVWLSAGTRGPPISSLGLGGIAILVNARDKKCR